MEGEPAAIDTFCARIGKDPRYPDMRVLGRHLPLLLCLAPMVALVATAVLLFR